jgi:hypothetical protein
MVPLVGEARRTIAVRRPLASGLQRLVRIRNPRQVMASPLALTFPTAPPDVRSAVAAASARTGVDFAYLMAKAAAESAFDPGAEAKTSSATGLYQFIDATWLHAVGKYGERHGLGREAAALADGDLDPGRRAEILEMRRDPKAAALMAAEHARDNRDFLMRTVGGPIGPTELYLAHFLGPKGSAEFVATWRAEPERAAAEMFPRAAAANRAVFYEGGRTRSLDEVHAFFAAKFGSGDAPAPPAARTVAPVKARAVAIGAQAAARAAPPAPGLPHPSETALAEALLKARLLLQRLPLPGDEAHV